MSGSTEDQLVSFFAYSFFIYPVTNYLISPARNYPRWRGAVYAIVFLLSISLLHIYHDNSAKGVNYYQLLNVPRGSSTQILKKAYRLLSLELHPDKNKSPDAIEKFRVVKHAFDVLSNSEIRRIYDILGESGAKLASQSVVDLKYIIIQMLVYYASTLVFTFLMTFSEPTGEVLNSCLFGLSVMLLIESLILLEKWKFPTTILPYHTPHEMITFLHKIYPALINCCRCLLTAFYVDTRAVRIEALQEVAGIVDNTANKVKEVSLQMISSTRSQLLSSSASSSKVSGVGSGGLMDAALQNSRIGGRGTVKLLHTDDIASSGDINSKGKNWFVKVFKSQTGGIAINVVLYIMARAVLSLFKKNN